MICGWKAQATQGFSSKRSKAIQATQLKAVGYYNIKNRVCKGFFEKILCILLNFYFSDEEHAVERFLKRLKGGNGDKHNSDHGENGKRSDRPIEGGANAKGGSDVVLKQNRP